MTYKDPMQGQTSVGLKNALRTVQPFPKTITAFVIPVTKLTTSAHGELVRLAIVSQEFVEVLLTILYPIVDWAPLPNILVNEQSMN